MKKLFFTLVSLFLTSYCFGQHVYQIRADTVRIYNTCDTAELVLENRTKDTLGFLFNKGKGRTEFRRLHLAKISPSQLAIVGQDTLDLDFSSYGDTRYDLLSTNFVTIPVGSSWLFGQWPLKKVVGYDAYNSPDMPALSNQATKGSGGKLYYNGLVVHDGSSGFDLAVNWDGELNGPNGVFVRTKDDTQTAWSNWRELLFKDYADTTYVSKTRTLTIAGGTGISVSPTGAQDLSANRSWTITNTGVTSINGATGAVTVAPASGGTNYIQNQNASPQSANFNISGFGSLLSIGTLAGTGVSGVAHSYFKTTGGILRFVFGLQNIESSGNAGSDFKLWRYNDDGSFLGTVFTVARSTGVLDFGATPTSAGNAIWHAGNHAAGAVFTPILTGANVLSTLTTNAAGHLTALTTRTMTAADISAAPSTGGTGYIQNQSASAQTNSNAWVSGLLKAGIDVSTQRDGANTFQGGLTLRNAADTRGGHFQLSGDATPGLATWIHDGTNWVERMRILSTGNVGINTTSPEGKLDVNGATYISGGANINLKASSSTSTDAGDLVFMANDNTEYARVYTSTGGTNLYLSTGSASTPRMTITNTGNVGIGTTAPGNPLHVTKTANVTPGTLSTYSVRITQSSADLGIGGDSSNNYIQSFNSKPLHINNQGNHVVFGVNSLSGVGVGVTPNFGLHVSKSGLQLGSVAIQNTDALSASSGGFVRIYNSGTPSASNQRLGGILLGTNPTGTTNRTGAQMEAYSESAWTDGSSHPTYLKFLTCPSGTAALAERMRITAAGNVGIGTTTPAAKLDVAGQVQATSFFQSSLRSLKKDIQPFTQSALQIFEKVQVRTFKFKADSTGKTNIGFIADEVPDQMATPKRNGVDQASTVALLVKAVQELMEQNKALQQRVNILELQMKENTAGK